MLMALPFGPGDFGRVRKIPLGDCVPGTQGVGNSVAPNENPGYNDWPLMRVFRCRAWMPPPQMG